MNIEAEIPEKLGFLFERDQWRYKGAYGGRGSAKSWGFARSLLAIAHSRTTRVLCGRETQKSIRDSVYRLLCDQLELMNMGPEWQTPAHEIRHRNGSLILFTGLADQTIESLKGFEGIDIFWGEEAQRISERSWSLIIPTIRKPRSEIWMTLNPDLETDPTYQQFVTSPPPNAKMVEMNWQDNPWFPEVLRVEKDYLYRVDPEAAAHVWGGQVRRSSNAQVLRGKYSVQSFTPIPGVWDGPYHGADWGFAVDPTVLVKVWIYERKLYIEDEAYGLGVEIDHTPALFDSISNVRNRVIRADSARPELISYMIRNGFTGMMAAQKWKGSVMDGVSYLRAFEEILIDPKCKHTIEEARLWSFKVDRLTDDVLPDLVDKHNHCFDATRYALEPIILGWAKKVPERDEDEDYNYVPSTSWMG